jgi:hypothetical protein
MVNRRVAELACSPIEAGVPHGASGVRAAVTGYVIPFL